MRLPIQSMQSVRLRRLQGDEDPWYRSVIVDFEERVELVLLLPSEKDREKPLSELEDEEATAEGAEAEGEGEAGETASAVEGGQPGEAADAADAVSAGEAGATPGDEGAPAATPAESPSPEGGEAPLEVGDVIVQPPPFQRGTQIEVEVSFPDGIRRFVSIIRRIDVNYGGAMRVDWPSEGTRIQRRDFVRVDVTYRAIAWSRTEEGKLEQVNGWTLDVSAGGVRLKLPQPLPAEQRVEMEIQTPALDRRTLQGRVVRSGEIAKKRNEQQFYWVAIEYVGVDEGLRNMMTQMVFDIQREQMKKSLT